MSTDTLHEWFSDRLTLLMTLEQARSAEECGCCGGYHPAGYTGDCRDDSKRWPA